ncbi:MAG: hypothetical protein ACJ74O_13890 [Frankiaceae bacterium]
MAGGWICAGCCCRSARVTVGADGVAMARATVAAAVLRVLGIGGRLAFALYVQHGGTPTIARFSSAHHVTQAGWVTGIVLMAFAEVISRTLVLWLRSRTVATSRTALLSVG